MEWDIDTNPQERTSDAAAARTDRERVLAVRALTLSSDRAEIISDLHLDIDRGERVGLIGESGSGKSLTALAIAGLTPDTLKVGGSVRLETIDTELVGAPEQILSRIRGARISMVFQEPMTALNPLMRVGRQVAEAMLIHKTVPSRTLAQQAVQALLTQVQLPDPVAIAKRYPHQLSGGQRQRVLLAMALANGPDLLICDEPTTALDVTVQSEILALIDERVSATDSSLLFITHDLALVASICERVMVMYGGRIVEAGSITEVFYRPRHPYTRGLVAASNLEDLDPDGRLRTIDGVVPGVGKFPSGCVFRNRCEHATDACQAPPDWKGQPAHGFACWHPLSPQTPNGLKAHG